MTYRCCSQYYLEFNLSKIFLLIFFLSSLGFDGLSQSVIRSTTGAGGSSQLIESNGKTYFISQSIGQASVIGTITKNGHTVRQGFQQPPGSFIIGEPVVNSDLEALVFPIPFQQSLDILFQEKIESDIQVFIHDVMGRLVVSESHVAAPSLRLSLEFLTGGSYLLNVATENKSFTRKIIKQ